MLKMGYTKKLLYLLTHKWLEKFYMIKISLLDQFVLIANIMFFSYWTKIRGKRKLYIWGNGYPVKKKKKLSKDTGLFKLYQE